MVLEDISVFTPFVAHSRLEVSLLRRSALEDTGIDPKEVDQGNQASENASETFNQVQLPMIKLLNKS